MKLDNSIAAIVTGGASGLGEAAARALAARGIGVSIFDLDETGTAVAQQIGGQFFQVDITSEDSVAVGLGEARRTFGQERILINCAGIAPPMRTVSKGLPHGRAPPGLPVLPCPA